MGVVRGGEWSVTKEDEWRSKIEREEKKRSRGEKETKE